jgi:hypothetical protein
MLDILIFRIILLSSFIIIAYTLGDWNRIEKYYPTILFAMVVNLTVSFLTYHHASMAFQSRLPCERLIPASRNAQFLYCLTIYSLCFSVQSSII